MAVTKRDTDLEDYCRIRATKTIRELDLWLNTDTSKWSRRDWERSI